MKRLSGSLGVKDHKSHHMVAFELPAGVTRLMLRLTTTPKRSPGALFDNMICLSLWGPDGPRGALHNNPATEFELEATRATPGLTPGALGQGPWQVGLDVFRILGPVAWELEIETCTTPLSPADALVVRRPRPRGPGWYRGDLHAHSLHSDGSWPVRDLVTWARSRELDFLALTDHNTVSGHGELHAMASDDLLTIGGLEMTTHHGHAVTHGAGFHDWRGAMGGLAQAAMARGASFTIAHPMAPGDEAGCTGCRWEHADVMPGPARQVEIWNGGPWSDYNEEGLALFRQWLGQGHRLVATAGSDIHGQEGGQGPIGFNHVEALALTEPAILQAVARGRNYLSSGPRLILTSGAAAMGETVAEGAGFHLHWQSGPVALWLHLVDASGRRHSTKLPPEAQGVVDYPGPAEGFLMAELRDAREVLHAVTNPIFLA